MRFAKRYVKPYSKSLQTGYRGFRRGLDTWLPAPAKPLLRRAMDYFDLVLVDHGVFRSIYSNTHQITPGVWRSAQPGPASIRRMARRGIKTIINLRGLRDCGSYRLQQAACKRHGIRLIDFPVQSRNCPAAQTIRAAGELFANIEYPVLLHCKSGADRAGLMAALLLTLKEGLPVEEATKQLSLKFGHIRQSDTGILDYVFEKYRQHNRQQPIAFMDWVNTVYNPIALKQEFRAKGWANLIVNQALHRE
jgi:protein tyrosine/serine phosphatase